MLPWGEGRTLFSYGEKLWVGEREVEPSACVM